MFFNDLKESIICLLCNLSPFLSFTNRKVGILNTKNQTPGVGNLPVVGNLFKGKANSDTMNELLIFIAPRIF